MPVIDGSMRRTPTFRSLLVMPEVFQNVTPKRAARWFALSGLNMIAGVVLTALCGMYRVNPEMAGLTTGLLLGAVLISVAVQLWRCRNDRQQAVIPVLYALTLGAAALGSDAGYFLGAVALSTLGWGKARGDRLVSALPAVLLGALSFTQANHQSPLTLLTLASLSLVLVPWERVRVLTPVRERVASLVLTGVALAVTVLTAVS